MHLTKFFKLKKNLKLINLLTSKFNVYKILAKNNLLPYPIK